MLPLAVALSLLPAASGATASGERPDVERVTIDRPSLLGGTRPLRVRGALPATSEAAPFAVIAIGSGCAASRFDDWTEDLARRGIAAFVVERIGDEPWWRYADALERAAWELRRESAAGEGELRGRLDVTRGALVAHADAAAAAARTVARAEGIGALALIDPGEPGPGVAWLAESDRPSLVVATAAGTSEHARAWFHASGAPDDSRWLVELATEQPFDAQSPPGGRVLESEILELLGAFARTQLRMAQPEDPAASPPATFASAARKGRIGRTVVTPAQPGREH